MSVLKPTFIQAFDLAEAWYRSLWELFHHKNTIEYMVEYGSFERQHSRREFDYLTLHITNPGHKRGFIPIIPEQLHIPKPTDRDKIERYFMHYIMSDKVAENETYTYGSRIQISLQDVIKMLRDTPGTNQAIIQIAEPRDVTPWRYGMHKCTECGHPNRFATDGVCFKCGKPFKNDPPCLRHIDCRVSYGKLHFMVYFRSWDLYSGLPENLGGLQLLKEYMAAEIGVGDGEMIVSSKGAHVYDYMWDHVKALVRYYG